MNVGICVYVRLCKPLCVYVCLRVCVPVCVHVDICLCACLHVCVCACVYVWLCMCVHACVISGLREKKSLYTDPQREPHFHLKTCFFLLLFTFLGNAGRSQYSSVI